MPNRILIADDDKDFVEVLRDLLESQGYEIDCAYEGVRTVEKAHRFKPDLIILDWKMPAGKGSAVLEMLAEKEDTQSIPIIVLSGTNEPGMEQTARSLGVKSMLQKPYESDELLDEISQVLKGLK